MLLGLAGASYFLLTQTTIEMASAATVLLMVGTFAKRGLKPGVQLMAWILSLLDAEGLLD